MLCTMTTMAEVSPSSRLVTVLTKSPGKQRAATSNSKATSQQGKNRVQIRTGMSSTHILLEMQLPGDHLNQGLLLSMLETSCMNNISK